MEKTYEGYKEHLQKIAHLSSAIMLLSWDQEVYMPKKGAEIRAKQFSTLSTIAHELATDQTFENLVDHLLAKSSFGFKEMRNLQETKKEIVEGKKLSADFIQRSAIARSEAFQSWQQAREEENFAVYVPSLKKMVALETERAGLLGYEKHPYDALLNLYEKGLTVEKLEKVFIQVKNQIVPLVKQIRERPQVDDSFLTQQYNKEKQFDFSVELLKYMNYDFDAGRQDL